MNALKKVGALLLASVMIFSMAGCKKSKSQDGAKSASMTTGNMSATGSTMWSDGKVLLTQTP